MKVFYKFSIEGNEYKFITEYGSAYSVSFIYTGMYFEDFGEVARYIYSIDIILNEQGNYSGTDRRIESTVTFIVSDFISRENKNIILYICEIADGKGMAREKKFSS